MRKLIKKSIVAAAIFAAITVNAANDFNGFSIKIIDAKMVSLTLKNNDGSSKIKVVDSNGNVLYRENFNGNYFSKKYNLMPLPSGEYFFEVEGQTKIKILPFKVLENNVEFENKIESIYFKPIVREDGDLVHISKMALNGEALSISLYDVNLGSLYNEELTGNVHLEKSLNISKLKQGNYFLVLKCDNKTFTHMIIKK